VQLVKHLSPFKKSFMPSRLQSLQTGPVYLAIFSPDKSVNNMLFIQASYAGDNIAAVSPRRKPGHTKSAYIFQGEDREG
jgi:hypothetical protein